MLNAAHTHFTVQLDGQIYYQEKTNNPLAGVPVARLMKGDAPLSPVLKVLDSAPSADKAEDKTDKDAALAHLQGYLAAYMADKIAVLIALSVPETFDFMGFDITEDEKAALRGITTAVYNNMGIVDRAAIQADIDKLTPESRRFLRTTKIRLGPVLAFQPDLNKPAAVRLRAVLYALYHGLDFPVSIPSDGSVSVVLDAAQRENKAFYKAIAYPVYGNRAIRVDMLDRVINAVYDGAKDGKFQAQHKMAEWLGCSINDLYATLEALGHKKIFDPAAAPEVKADKDATPPKAEDKIDAKADVKPQATPAPLEGVAAQTIVETVSAAPKPPENAADAASANTQAEAGATIAPITTAQSPAVKPELATFALKKGKLSGGAPVAKNRSYNKTATPARNKQGQSPSKFKKKGKRNKAEQRPKKNMQFDAKTRPEDSPFAVLAALKDNE